MKQMENIALAGTNDKLITETALLAGKLLLESGSETSRVETTINHMIQTALKQDPERDFDTYVILNVIFIRVDTFKSSLVQVRSRGNNLGIVDQVNQISRDYENGNFSLEETYQQLTSVQHQLVNPLSFRYFIAVALLGAFIVFLYQGAVWDMVPSMISALSAYFIYHSTSKFINLPFVSEFLASFCGGCMALAVSRWFGSPFEIATIGAVVPLVPGLGITNAMRDIMDRHYVTGITRFVECLCIGAALGGGIAAVDFLFV